MAVLGLLEGRSAALDPYTTALAASLGSLVSASWGAKVALDRYPARRSRSVARRSRGA